jgi:hypothetical protein
MGLRVVMWSWTEAQLWGNGSRYSHFPTGESAEAEELALQPLDWVPRVCL